MDKMAESSTERPGKGQKTALVTGVGVGGIGGALATQLHQSGYFVFCAARRPAAIEALLKPGMVAIELDVTSTEAVNSALSKVSALSDGRLDVLINNAGSATHLPALDLDVDGVVASMCDVNILGPMRMVKASSDLLISAKGTVVNIGSVAPLVPLVFSSAYNATKAALHAYGEGLRIEMAPFGVNVVTVITGGVQSNIVRESDPKLPAGSRYEPVRKFWLQRVNQSQDKPMATEEYARNVVRMLSKRKKPNWFWTGGSITLIWLLYHLMPKSLRFILLTRRSGLRLLKA